jgi:type II secretory pathway component PulF|tara:strand:+ start:68 stop:322 length:255 start_codon:yes stop_codon:yes gene_type:complete
MTKLGFIVFTAGVMFFLCAMMIDTFDNLLLNFDYLIHALTDKEYFLSSIEGTFRVMLWFFMMLIGGLICLSGLKMMKLTDRKNL